MIQPDNTSSGHLWAEEGETVVGPVASVAPVAPIDKVYTFRVPEEWSASIEVGQRVRIPLGRSGRLVVGFVTSLDEAAWKTTLKPIESLVDPRSYLNDELLALGAWMAKHYACPLGRTLAALVPEAVRKQAGFRKVEYVRMVASLDDIAAAGRVGAKQRAVLDAMADVADAVDLATLRERSGASRATVKAMVEKGWLSLDAVKEPVTPPDFDEPIDEPDFELNADQRSAAERIEQVIDDRAFRVLLLYGASGSGKTEVYIRAMRHALAAGRQVIMLVPEIALTTQLVQRLARRFTDVAIVHSGLTGVERSLTWSAIRDGIKRVVIGTRSAVFAPCPDLGLIVVDEEQEPSYKNLQAPRFGVRDVAVMRASRLGIPVVLGSATPSLESWHNCSRLEHYALIRLPNRVRDLPMPKVVIADLNQEYQEKSGVPLLSRILIRRLGQVLERKEQAVILMNRRGYSTVLLCPQCKHVMRCPHCDATLVLHAATHELRCHHCHLRQAMVEACPNASCDGRLVRVGGGTQRIEERLGQLFPDATIERMDSDTMRNAELYRRIIGDFEAKRIDVIVGTQMIAKGLDFPHVSFVGVIGADTRFSTDFRAGERMFQLVTQVAGRAGRYRSAGEVVVQTEEPESAALRAAVGHDFEAFAAGELEIRRRTNMPPFVRLARYVVADALESRARESAGVLARAVQAVVTESASGRADVLGPMPCAIARMRNQYRYEFVVRAADAGTMQAVLGGVGDRRVKLASRSVVVDVDPLSMT